MSSPNRLCFHYFPTFGSQGSSFEMVKEVKALTQKEVERQQRKIAKDLRRKQYNDIAVQGTNDYSIVSKRSVEKLYTSKITADNGVSPSQYFQHFVKKFQRRSPAINRGYWTRMEAIKQTSYKIINDSIAKGQKVVVINLGAGYDPLAFQYLDPSNPDNSELKDMVSFIDVDYPDLNKIKIQMIKQSRELSEIIGEEQKSDFQGIDLRTKNYTALSCNLKDIDLFLSQLGYLDLNHENITKIYIAEVSIAYMLPEFADPVIDTTSKFPNTHFLLLEQLLPAGEFQGFARTMLFHFNKLNSPLNSVSTYPKIQDQIKRFKTFGFNGTVEALDLNTFWQTLPKELRDKVAEVEAFDEWEEFILFAQHYLILHASNTALELFENTDKYDFNALEIDEAQSFSLQRRSEILERKFPGATVLDADTILINGGASTSRLNTTVTNDSGIFYEHDTVARMSHCLTSLGSSCLLTGGRTAPNKPLVETLKLSSDNTSWHYEGLDDLPDPRSRHSTFKVNDDIYIYGGNFTGSTFLRFRNEKWEGVIHEGLLVSKTSSLLAYNGSRGVIVGGMNQYDEIESSLHVFKVEDGVVKSKLLFEHPLFNRFSGRAEFISEDEIILVGGVSNLFLFDQTTTIVKVNINTKEIRLVKLDEDSWRSLPLLVGFQLLKYKGRLITVGGGAVCYSFGSIWNDILVIGEELENIELKIESYC